MLAWQQYLRIRDLLDVALSRHPHPDPEHARLVLCWKTAHNRYADTRHATGSLHTIIKALI